MDYRGRVVSLLLTANAAASDRTEFHDAAAHIERTSVNGFSVLSVPASDHMILLVSDLSQEELGALAQVVAIPLARQLEPGSMARVFDKLAILSPPSVTLRVSGPCMRPEL